MIKNGRFCKYHGNEFKINRDNEGNTIILTKDDKIIDSTFIDKYGSGVYSKRVEKEELEEFYTYETYGIIDNCRVNVEKENQEFYFVGTADCKVAEVLGLSRCDKYYYEGKIPKEKVELIEEKKELKL
ncbi:hypothetical protein [Roseburia sp. 499]|uniref:hypothetical protein n=1 Tax=Roseburia sp. 499 TaxID=1261634 RepID=UPI0009510FF8|nr:hypothetical protein [Roseburia sp. 499]WVK69613.1 hypothetical protein BIV20_14885 [Roseburia sp. 499]